MTTEQPRAAPADLAEILQNHLFDLEFVRFKTLVESKVAYLEKLASTDIFGLPEAQRQRHFNRLKIVQNEAVALAAFAEVLEDHLHRLTVKATEAFHRSTGQWASYWGLQVENAQLRKDLAAAQHEVRRLRLQNDALRQKGLTVN
jgi:hypothetical protein